MRSCFWLSGMSPTSESDYPSIPFSTSILFTDNILIIAQIKPSMQHPITIPITAPKLRGA